MQLDPQTGVELFIKAAEQKAEERTWELWVSIYPYFNYRNFVKYEDFRKEITAKQFDGRSKLEIITMAEKIKAADQQNFQDKT